MNTKAEVSPIYFDGLDCVDNTILTVCNFIRGEYKNALWNSWNLLFIKKFLSDRNAPLAENLISENVKKFHGLEFRPVSCTKQKLKLLKEYFEADELVIIGIKTNHCPWQKSYGKSEYNLHYLIVTKIEEKGIFCTDSMPQKMGELIEWEDVEKGIFSIIRLYDKWNGKEETANSISLKELHRSVKKNVKANQIVKLSKTIKRDFEVCLGLNQRKEVWKLPLYNLFNMGMGIHIQFLTFLTQSGFQECEELKSRMRILGAEWEKLKILVVKLHREYLSNKLNKEKLENYQSFCLERLAVIVQQENETRDYFLQVCELKMQNPSGVCIPPLKSEMTEKDNVIRLEYNEVSHMVFAEEYLIKNPICFGQNWSTAIAEFYMPEIEVQKFNCLYCDRQVFSVNKKIRQIFLLQYATYGTQFEEIGLNFGGKIYSYTLGASDWTEDALTEEVVVWKSDFIEKSGVIQSGKLVVKSITVDYQNDICQNIILPRCKDLHIFAITVRTVD